MKRRALLILSAALMLSFTACDSIGSTYKSAQKLLQEQKYEEAAEKFEKVSTYEEAAKYLKYCKAQEAVEQGEYANAVTEFESLGEFLDCEDLVVFYTAYQLELSGTYDDLCEADKLYDTIALYTGVEERKQAVAAAKETLYQGILEKVKQAGEEKSSELYEEAIALFQGMPGYSDSADQIIACETAIKDIAYEAAIALKEEGKYEEAIAAFEEMNGYRDSVDQITACENGIKDIAYEEAVALKEARDYFTAYNVFESLGDYKNSNELKENLKKEHPFEVASVGDIVELGSYEQDNDLSNGKEAIEWIVLAKEDDRILVTSKYALDCQLYNREDVPVTWEESTLRSWLNSTFMEEAFSEAERTLIEITNVKAENNPRYDTTTGNDTKDQVFLLSIQEAESYFASDEARKCAPTAYAISQGAFVSNDYKTAEGQASGWWWLRSPGAYSYRAASVSLGGSVHADGNNVSNSSGGVRPALWINLEP